MVKNTRFDPLLSLDVRTAPVRRSCRSWPRAPRPKARVEAVARSRRLAIRGRRRRAAVRRCGAAFLSRARAPDAFGAHRGAGRGAGVARRIAPLARISAAPARATNRTAWSSRPPASPRSPLRCRRSICAATPRLRRRVARIADHSLAVDIEYVASVSSLAGARAAGHAHPLRRRLHAFPGSGAVDRHRRSPQRSAHRAAARGGRCLAPSLLVAPRRRAHGAHRSQPLRHLGQWRTRARTGRRCVPAIACASARPASSSR